MEKASTILFVDDEELVIKYFRKAFNKSFKIETTNSVYEAKKILDGMHSEIGVLLTDLHMPKQTGIELLLYARDHYPDIVRLLTTSFSDLENNNEAINNADIFRLLQKPWNIESLETILYEAIQKHWRSYPS